MPKKILKKIKIFSFNFTLKILYYNRKTNY